MWCDVFPPLSHWNLSAFTSSPSGNLDWCHYSLDRGTTSHRRGARWGRQNTDSHLLVSSYWKQIFPAYDFCPQLKETNTSIFSYIKSWKKYLLLQIFFPFFGWLFWFYVTVACNSKQIFGCKWIIIRNKWPHLIFKFVFSPNSTYRKSAITQMPLSLLCLPDFCSRKYFLFLYFSLWHLHRAYLILPKVVVICGSISFVQPDC